MKSITCGKEDINLALDGQKSVGERKAKFKRVIEKSD
jgi:hypothetical protein